MTEIVLDILENELGFENPIRLHQVLTELGIGRVSQPLWEGIKLRTRKEPDFGPVQAKYDRGEEVSLLDYIRSVEGTL